MSYEKRLEELEQRKRQIEAQVQQINLQMGELQQQGTKLVDEHKGIVANIKLLQELQQEESGGNGRERQADRAASKTKR